MIEHLKYPKISCRLKAASKKTADNTGEKQDEQAVWCVTEKVHGANFSIYIFRSGKICCGKRTGLIEEGDQFFGYFSVVERLRSRVNLLSHKLFERYGKEESTENDYMILFGELFGGGYPGLQTCNDESFENKPVQTGVWYSPKLEFMLFDICVPLRMTAEESNYKMHFLPFVEVLQYANEHSIFCSEPLTTGSLSKVCQFDEHFSSTIPKRLGLPPLKEPNNAEGVVVRILNGPPIACDDVYRQITKTKAAAFSDGEGSAPKSSSNKHIKEWLMSLALDTNLVASASSKVGRIEKRSNWDKIVGCILQDIVEYCDEECEEVFKQLIDEIKYSVYNFLASLAEKQCAYPIT